MPSRSHAERGNARGRRSASRGERRGRSPVVPEAPGPRKEQHAERAKSVPTRSVLSVGSEVRLVTDSPLSYGRLGRVVELHDWGAVLETNFGSGSYRAAWHEMEPVPVTEFHNPGANGHHPTSRNGVARNYTIVPVWRVPARLSAAPPTGNPCPNCQGVNMAHTGSCITCQDCGYNEGCG